MTKVNLCHYLSLGVCFIFMYLFFKEKGKKKKKKNLFVLFFLYSFSSICHSPRMTDCMYVGIYTPSVPGVLRNELTMGFMSCAMP